VLRPVLSRACPGLCGTAQGAAPEGAWGCPRCWGRDPQLPVSVVPGHPGRLRTRPGTGSLCSRTLRLGPASAVTGSPAVAAAGKRHCYPASHRLCLYLTTVLGKSGRPSGKAARASDLPGHGY